MKTKLLIIATLVSGGMIFNSCQKDNALIEETSVEQLASQQDATSATENALLVDSSYPGDLDADMITNAPDPFYKVTNISYWVKKTSFVRLIVYRNKDQKVALLVNEFEGPGKFTVEFDASKLPAGKYVAVLTIGSTVYTEEMTKLPKWQISEESTPVSEQ